MSEKNYQNDTDVEALSERTSQDDCLDHQETERQQALQQLSLVIMSRLGLNDIYHAFARHADRLLPYDRLTIILGEENKMRVVYVFGRDEDDAERLMGTTLPTKSLSISRVMAQGQPILRNNISTEIQSAEDALLQSGGVRSYMIIPLRAQGEAFGVWIVNSRHVGAYSPDDMEIAQSMSSLLAVAIDNRRLSQLAQQESSERKRAEGSLWNTVKRFQSLIESANDIVVILDAHGSLRYTSPSVERILGYSSSDMIGREFC